MCCRRQHRRVRSNRRRAVSGAKSVDTAWSSVLNARYRPGRYCAAAPSDRYPRRAASRGPASPSTRAAAFRRSNPGPAPAAPRCSTLCGAHASGASNWNASAVVSRVFGTTSTHSSTNRPVSACVVLIAPIVCTRATACSAACGCPAAGGSPTQRSPRHERQLRDAAVAAARRCRALRRRAGTRPVGDTPSRTRAYRANQVCAASGSPPCVCRARRQRGCRVRSAPAASQREPRQHHERLAEHRAHPRRRAARGGPAGPSPPASSRSAAP